MLQFFAAEALLIMIPIRKACEVGSSRLNDESGKQSMRFGIRINNADQVKDCSVDVTVGEKTVTIGTANEKYRNIYDKSEDGKTVVYTVVVKGIDAKNFGTNISFVGKANAIDATTQIADTPSTTKNVKNVVSVC